MPYDKEKLKEMVSLQVSEISNRSVALTKTCDCCVKIEDAFFYYVHKSNLPEHEKRQQFISELSKFSDIKLSCKWFNEIVFSSPRILRSYHSKLVDFLIENGIPRKFSDFREPSNLISLVIFCGLLVDLPENLKIVVNDSIANINFTSSITDSLTLALFIAPDLWQKQLQDDSFSCNNKEVKDLLVLTQWLYNLKNDYQSCSFLPLNDVSEKFLKASSLRGLRRHFARNIGYSFGKFYVKSLKKGLNVEPKLQQCFLPQKNDDMQFYDKSQVILMIEWFLAFQRCLKRELPEEKEIVRLFAKEINMKINEMNKSIIDFLRLVLNPEPYVAWLNSFKFSLPETTTKD